MGSFIAQTWVYATIRIHNEWGSTGTGFLVSRKVDDKGLRIFLVTNKHVLNADPALRASAAQVNLDFNIKTEGGNLEGRSVGVLLVNTDGSRSWREHPNADTDVLAIEVTIMFNVIPNIERRWADYSDFVDKAKLEEFDITIGDDVMVVGYPSGLTQGKTNFPIVRAGIIATRIGEPYEDDKREADGVTRRRSVRGFLVDGATIPGSSGSPVVLRPVVGRVVKGNIVLGTPPALLLGIIAETKFAQGPTIGLTTYAGLGLAFDAETVKETVELFFR